MRIKISLLAGAMLALIHAPSFAANFYISPSGSDSNGGTLAAPFKTIMKAQTAASSGDTVYLRGGTYNLTNSDISTYTSAAAVVNNITKSGISYVNYASEVPIFNFSSVTPSGYRVYGFRVTASNCVFKGFQITGTKITITGVKTQSENIRVEGNNNRFERLSIHDTQAIGWYLVKGSNNLVLNVDAYNNKGLDSYSYGNIDGFGVHPSATTGTGNVIRGSRAWFNSDDGYDFISAQAAVTVENSWAFWNGYDSSFTSLGDGNGFKAGGYGSNGDAYPSPVPRHVIERCLAVHNKTHGFYANHHIGGQDWIHNTAVNNVGDNYNMLSTLADNDTDVAGYDHYMRNNLGYGGTPEVSNLGSAADNDITSNYFNLPVAITNNDFLNISAESQLTNARQSNGDLPVITFAHLKSGSDLINAGTNLGDPYNGSAPDLGAFEF